MERYVASLISYSRSVLTCNLKIIIVLWCAKFCDIIFGIRLCFDIDFFLDEYNFVKFIIGKEKDLE